MKRWGVILVVVALLFVGLFAIVPGIAQAQEQVGLVPCGGTNQPPCDLCHVFSLLNNILNFIFFRVVPPIAVVLIMIGGFFWFLAAGDPAKVKQGKDVFSAVVIGLILIYGAWIFVSTSLTWMGVAQWTGLGSWWQVDCELGKLQYTGSGGSSSGGGFVNIVPGTLFAGAATPYGSPISGTITSLQINRIHPITGKPDVHTGIDIGAPESSAICSSAEGKIMFRGPRGGYGNAVIVDHGTYTTLYAHMKEFANKNVGDNVSRGDVIGYVDSTGTSTGHHLHYEIFKKTNATALRVDAGAAQWGVCGSQNCRETPPSFVTSVCK
ncbi:MAG: peptidoglycan DD-metalloendopeptidase family protein [bacterium]|nr:peptidoglycan DD-metalloendopeptidase family protein [bacterium]